MAAAPEHYTLLFQNGGRVNVRADCNRGGGSYEVNGGAIRFGAIALTRMGCPPGSQDGEFLRSLAQAAAYAIERGDLVLTLADGAAMRFRPRALNQPLRAATSCRRSVHALSADR